MSYVEFTSILPRAFKTFTGEQQAIWLTSTSPGLVFVRGINQDEPNLGSNGAGKSSIFEALCWCLYGQTPDGMKTNDVAPWSGGEPEVLVGIRKKEKLYNLHRKGHKILIDNNESSQDGIEQLVGMSFEVFKHTVLFGQGENLFFDLSPKEMMEILVSALTLDRWNERADVAKAKTVELLTEADDIDKNINTNEAVLQENERQLKAAKLQIDDWEEQRRDTKKGIRIEIKELEVTRDKQHKLLDKAIIDEERIGLLIRDLAAAENLARKREREAGINYQKAVLTINGLEEVRDALKIELGIDSEICPTCGQSLKGTKLAEHKRNLKKRIDELNRKVKQGVPENIAVASTKASYALTKASNELIDARNKEENIRRSILRLRPEVSAVEARIRVLQQQVEEKTEEINPHRSQVKLLRQKINRLLDDIDALKEDYLIVTAKAKRHEYWIKGFKQVRLHQLTDLLEELELVTNSLLPESGLHGWEVQYRVERETKKGTVAAGLTVIVVSPKNKKPVKWGVWSGGEAHRLRLVGALALSEVLLSHAGVNTNLEVLDEPTRDLSVEGVYDLCEFLANRAKSLDKDIFLTGHNVIESAHFADTITIVKSKGAVSHIQK